LVYNEVPSIGHLRVFGCGAYVHLPAEVRKNKLSPRSKLMIFLGYPDGVKGYLFMRLPYNTLFKGTTAIFDEEIMPKCDKSPAFRSLNVERLDLLKCLIIPFKLVMN